MEVLIIDDSDFKVTDLESYLKQRFEALRVVAKRSYQSGLKEVLSNGYDLVMLDMSMPTFDTSFQERGHRFRNFAGKEILIEMERKAINAKTIIVTQFDTFPDGTELSTLHLEMKRRFQRNYIGSVFYDASVSEWKGDLDGLLKRFS